MSVFEWNSNTVDNILLQGDSKYGNSAFESGLIPRERYYFILLMRKAAKMDNLHYRFQAAKHDGRRLQAASERNGRRWSGHFV